MCVFTYLPTLPEGLHGDRLCRHNFSQSLNGDRENYVVLDLNIGVHVRNDRTSGGNKKDLPKLTQTCSIGGEKPRTSHHQVVLIVAKI